MDFKKMLVLATIITGFSFVGTISMYATTLNSRQDDKVKSLSGYVNDESGALEFVTVVLTDGKGKILAGATSDKEGSFKLEVEEIQDSTFITYSLMGYKEYSCSIEAAIEDKGKLKSIVLQKDTETLANAVVTGKRPLLEHRFDKIVMNVSEMAIAQTGNAMDVVRNAPGVTVDKDGNIKLNGQAVAVWVDGRPSQMSGKDLESYLNGNPGTNIEKIEVITSPSAKYDADGSGGIINIKMKKGSLKGLSGSLSASAGMNFITYDWETRFSANLMYKTDKTYSFISITPSHYTSIDTMEEEKRYGTDYDMGSKSEVKTKNGNSYGGIRLGNDWYISDKDVLGFIFNTNLNYGGNTPLKGSLIEWRDYNSGNPVLWTDQKSLTYDKSNYQFYSLNLNYTHTFDESKGQELTINADYSRNNRNTDSRLSNVYIQKPDDEEITAAGENPSDYKDNGWNDVTVRVLNLFSAKADYSHIFWNNSGRIEAGAKAAVSVTHNVFNKYDYDPANSTTAENPKENDDFTYTEQVYAAYINVAKQFNEKWNAQLGLRGEATVSNGDWKGSSNNRAYFDVFPNVFVNYMPSQKAILSLNYSYRLNRPGYWQLNPFRTYINATTYTEGNQFLDPSYGHNLNFTGVFWSRFTTTLGYRHVKDMSDMQLPIFEDGGTMALKYMNYGQADAAYLSLGLAEQPLTKWWTLTLNTNFSYNFFRAYANLEEQGIFLTDSQKKKESFSFFGYASTTFFLPKQWKISVDGWLATPQDVGLFRVNTMGSANLTIEKALLEGKANIALTINNFTNSMNNTISVQDKDVTTYLIRQTYDNIGARISFRWSFGQNTAKRRNNVGVLDEMSRMN